DRPAGRGMIRVAAAAAVALALVAGSARADTFAVLQAPLVLPTAETPNHSASLVLPPRWTERATAERTLPFSTLRGLWERAGAAYGIPWNVLASINKIESNFGRNMGPSSAGAVGWMQFMPETWLRWGMDANGDGLADPWDPEDAVYAAARYLAAAGGRADVPRAIFAYNHADWYVRDVLELAAVYANGGPEVAFELDGVEEQLQQAELEVADASERLTAVLTRERRLARQEAKLLARARAAVLLSDRLALQKQATLAGVRREAVRAEAAGLREELAASEERLRLAREQSSGMAFAAGDLVGAPVFDGDYVFPVGGGAGAVSVARGHHDYPAADIAAPAGSPVYALADAVVVRSWRLPDSRCGIGATLRTGDGLVWTYCHLSYLDPGAVAGRVLSAGTPVGLVGSTGRSTGPHLHLQLQPATAFPQEQEWFRRFAGSAFSWQGEQPARTLAQTAPHEVFAVVPTDDPGVVFFTR
ncbi:MAG: lytic murein transglycosylase, partial [Actinomycetota bacterium]|nr:lytic murein transglycosylase [Actinomycetota bacterium]